MTRTRDKILRSTQTLLAQSGLSGAGLNQLIAASATPRGSLYHHFPAGKEQWVSEALRAYSEYFQQACASLLTSAPTAGAGIEAVLQLLAGQLEKTGFSGGCPVGAVVLDLDADTLPLRLVCQQIMSAWEAALASHLGSLAPAQQADLARFVLMTLEGALMLARLQQNQAPLLTAGRMLHEYIDMQSATPARS